MATGDLRNNLAKLAAELKSIHYKGAFYQEGLIRGDPDTFILLLRFSVVGFSRLLNKQLLQEGFNLHSKTDLRFIEGVFQLLREKFHYVPSLSLTQFMSPGFSERKIIFLYEAIRLCKHRHNQLHRERQMQKEVELTEEVEKSTTLPIGGRERYSWDNKRPEKSSIHNRNDVVRDKNSDAQRYDRIRSAIGYDVTDLGSTIRRSKDDEKESDAVQEERVEVEKGRITRMTMQELFTLISQRMDKMERVMGEELSKLSGRVSLMEGRMKFVEEQRSGTPSSARGKMNNTVGISERVSGEGKPLLSTISSSPDRHFAKNTNSKNATVGRVASSTSTQDIVENIQRRLRETNALFEK